MIEKGADRAIFFLRPPRISPINSPVMSPNLIVRLLRIRIWILAAMPLVAIAPTSAGIFDALSDSEKLTAVSSRAHNGYVRTRLADGSFKPETFALGNGGVLGGYLLGEYMTNDPTLNDLTFPGIVRMLSGPLASQNYISVRDPNATNLLIMVHWGRTVGGAHARDGSTRDLLNFDNAKLLGFDSDYSIQSMTDPSTVYFGRSFRSGMLDNLHADVLSAIEVDRYYVILRAYDFQAAWKEKKLNLQWETRFSLSERRHDFERDLPGMAQDAAVYFGQDSYGLVLKPIPEGHVRVGEATPVEDQTELDEGNAVDPHSGAVGDWQRTSPGPRFLIHIDPNGGSTFENPEQATVPVRVTTNAGAVTVKVPGWGIIIRGTLKGNHISGTIMQYDRKNSLTLTRMAPPAGERPVDGETLRSSGGTPEK
jgi:hypothetical protein